jgi:non-heme chloroperoxidase
VEQIRKSFLRREVYDGEGADELSKNYRVIAVDPRSQGESEKPTYGLLPETRARDYKELVDQLGLKQPVLIGWSMGCGELLSYVEQFWRRWN